MRAAGGLLALASIAVLVLGLSLLDHQRARSGGLSPNGPGAMVTDAAAEEGRELYLRSCASCHGPDGQGTERGPAIVEVGLASWDFMLRTGRMPAAAPGDPAYRQEPAFRPEQVASLLAFAETIVTGGPSIPEVTVDRTSLRRGWELYIQNCAACHAATGAGAAVGGGFIAPSLLESDPLTVAEAVVVGPGAMPAFPFLAEEVDALTSYVESLREGGSSPGGISLGGLGPVAEGFVAVVVGLGALVLVCRFVGRASG